MMTPETMHSYVMDGVVQLVDMNDCASAIARWRDLMEIMSKCPERCRTINHQLEHGLCALCLERALCEMAASTDHSPHEAAKYLRATDGLRAWIKNLGLRGTAANDKDVSRASGFRSVLPR